MSTSQTSGVLGIVKVSWAPLRREPCHAAEMVSQALLGEILHRGSDPGPSSEQWASVSTPDGYSGFLTTSSFRGCSEEEAADWEQRADGFSLGTTLRRHPDGPDTIPSHAPWGSRLQVESDAIVLPGGARALPSDLPVRRETARPTIVASALMWLGTPYLWGGRTEQGADCSGFVQSVYSLHGIGLKRDSRDQFEAGAVVAGSPAAGDLLFFAWDDNPVSHVGLDLGDGRMIHASETRGCVAIDVLGAGAFGRRLAEGHVGTVRPLS